MRRVLIGLVAIVTACSSSTAVPSITEARSTTTPVATTTTLAPTTTASPVTLPAREAAIDVDAGTVFGFAVGLLDPKTVTSTLEPVLGPATLDTGWYFTSGGAEGDCIGGKQQRVLRWGDLGFAFWNTQSDQGAPTLWSWTVGDPASSGWGDRKEPLPIIREPSLGLSSADGIGVGASTDDLSRRFGSRLYLADATGQETTPAAATHGIVNGTSANGYLGFSLQDGKTTGIGSTLAFC